MSGAVVYRARKDGVVGAATGALISVIACRKSGDWRPAVTA